MRRSATVWIACCWLLYSNAIGLGQDEVAEEDGVDVSAEEQLAVPPRTGSQLVPDANRCAMCHTEPALWDEAHQQLLIQPEGLASDVHWKQGVNCHDCHGGDPSTTDFATAHIGLVSLTQMRRRCAVCHDEQWLGIVKGVHAKAGEKDEQGRGLPLDCSNCHGANPHTILTVKDQNSPVFLNNQVNTCGSCHKEDEKTYRDTVHGKGLIESGLMVTAVCANCHGAHGIYYAADRRSTLNVSNVATTCSQCHQFIEQRLMKSVHGMGAGLGSASEEPAAGGTIRRQPSCTDCHQGHHLLRSDMVEFRLDIRNTCGNCHADMSSRYAMSMHGELTRQGYAAAAECADCHGSHDILPVDDPNSTLAVGKNRLQTCKKCHAFAVSNFAKYDPHANFKDATGYPELHSLYSWIQFCVNFFFILFLLHAFLWFIRALVDRIQHGGHKTLIVEEYSLPRFGPILRPTYLALIVAFVGLTASGVALKYSDQEWGQMLARGLGGVRSASFWHHFFAVLAIVAGLIHVGRSLARINRLREEQTWKQIIFGPDSLVPNGRDVRDLGKMLLWFVGFGPKPGFERWAYWEKLDYWALCLAATVIGFSGLMLWYPNLFCVVLPGTILNVAKMVHSQFAIYTASFLFLIHFFHAHFRPEKFPIDLSVMTGMVNEQHLREYRPDYIARLEREGRLDEKRQKAPSRKNVWLNIVGGVLIFTLGFFLLAITILASLGE